MKCELWSMKCELWNVTFLVFDISNNVLEDYEMQSMNCEVWTMKCEVTTGLLQEKGKKCAENHFCLNMCWNHYEVLLHNIFFFSNEQRYRRYILMYEVMSVLTAQHTK